MIRAIRKVSKTHFFSFSFLIKIFFYFFAQTFLNFFGMLPYSRGAFLFFFYFFFSKNGFFLPKQILMFFPPFFSFYKKTEIPYHSFFIPFSFQKECLNAPFHSFFIFIRFFLSFFIPFIVFLYLLIIVKIEYKGLLIKIEYNRYFFL